MQPNSITLAVDEENDGVGLVNRVYNRFEEHLNRSVYVGENHTLTTRDTLSLYRTPPKTQGNFRGVAKTAVKFSRDVVVTGVDGVAQITAPIIGEISFSLPVGVDAADSLLQRQIMLALLDLDAIMAPLNDQQMV